MGLDFLDVTYRLEKAHGIHLSQDDFLSIYRDSDIEVGDLYELVLKKMHLRDVGRYDLGLNRRLWLEVQQALHVATDVPHEQIELGMPLAALLPRERRRADWDAFRAACPHRVRELEYPRAVFIAGSLLALATVAIEQLHLWQRNVVKWLWPLLGILGLWMIVETYLKVLAICAPLRVRFPSGMTTVKDLCRMVLATNYAEICSTSEIPIDERTCEVWTELVEQLVQALGVSAEQITFRTRLVRDLGME